MGETPDLLVQIASRHAVYFEGAKTQYVNEFEYFLELMQTDLEGQINAVSDPESFKGRRLNKLLTAVRATLASGFGDYETVWKEQLAELVEYEAGFEARSLNQVVKADFDLPSPTQLVNAAFARPLSVEGVDEGALLEAFFKSWTDKSKRRVEGAIRLGFANGETTAQIVRRISGSRASNYRDGIVSTVRREVQLMARTALQHVANSARESVWDANRDIVEEVEFLAVLDGRTSKLCRSLSGRRFEVGKGPIPPLHIACRSALVPVLNDGLDFLDGAGRQFSRGEDGVKRVSADLTYYDWLKTQSPAFQDSVVGAARGKLLRDGGLSAKRFSELQLDKNFKGLTLEEMRRLEPLAFERAFGKSPTPKKAQKAAPEPTPKRASRSFKYKTAKPPRTAPEANRWIVDNGIADRADLKGLSIGNVPEAMIALLEVTERFQLGPLQGIGPASRFGLRGARKSNAAIFTGRNRETGEIVQTFHMPTTFTSAKRFEQQKRVSEANAATYVKTRKSRIESNEFPDGLEPDLKARFDRMPEEDFNWSITSPRGHGAAQKNIVYHEYGHVIHLGRGPIGARINDFLAEEQPLRKGWHFLLSRYAGTNSKELVAESFALYMDGSAQHYRIHPRLLAIFKEFDLEAG